MKVKQLTDNGINKQKIVAKGKLIFSIVKIFTMHHAATRLDPSTSDIRGKTHTPTLWGLGCERS